MDSGTMVRTEQQVSAAYACSQCGETRSLEGRRDVLPDGLACASHLGFDGTCRGVMLMSRVTPSVETPPDRTRTP